MKRRFFFHYYRQYHCMSVHWKGACYRVKEVDCRVACITKWRKRQPNLVMEGFASDVIIENNIALIQ